MTAGRAESVQFQFVGGNGKPIPGGDLLLQPFDVTIFELHDFAAVGADEVIVVALVGNVIVLRLASEMSCLSETGITEKIHGPVNRREPDVVALLG